MTTSRIAMKNMKHAAKTEFGINLTKKHELNALAKEKENQDDA